MLIFLCPRSRSKSWMSVGMSVLGVYACVWLLWTTTACDGMYGDTCNTSKSLTHCHYDIIWYPLKNLDFVNFLVVFGPRVGVEILNECRNRCFKCLCMCIRLLWTTVCSSMSNGHIQHIQIPHTLSLWYPLKKILIKIFVFFPVHGLWWNLEWVSECVF